MEGQKILADPNLAIERKWGSKEQCPCSVEVFQLIDTINVTKQRLKALKQDKKSLTRNFRQPESDNQKLTETKQRIGEISSEIKQFESALKQNYVKLTSFFTEIDSESAIPAKFQSRPVDLQRSNAKPQETRIEIVDSSIMRQWDDYVQNHARSSIYHFYCIATFLKSVHKVSTSYLAAFNNDNAIVGVMPAVNLHSKLFGSFLVSMPYFNYGGPLADTLEIERKLLDAATKLAKQNQLEHVEVRATYPINDWTKKTEKLSMLLRLPNDIESLSDNFGAKVRAQIALGRRNGLTTYFGHTELMDDFYTVFARNMRDLGTPIYSQIFFKQLVESLKTAATVVVVRYKDKPVSCAILLSHKGTVEIPWASSLRSYNRMNANMLMYGDILKHAVEMKFSFFDFGRSTIDSPTYKFKKQWGAEPVQHYWHYWLAEDSKLPQLNPTNSKYKLAIAAWKILPVWLTRLLGPKIAAYLP